MKTPAKPVGENPKKERRNGSTVGIVKGPVKLPSNGKPKGK